MSAQPAAAQTGGAQRAEPYAEPLVSVTGEGLVRKAPDRAWVTIGAESRAKSPRDAQAQNAKAMNAVQQRLEALGIPRDAVRTAGVDLQLESDYVDGRQVPRGYVARNRVEVRLDDIARVGEVVDNAVATGATSLHGLRFDLKDRDKAEREALRLAVASARARAEAAAEGAGMSLGRIVRIAEPGLEMIAPPPPPAPMMRGALQEAVTVTPVEAGEMEIRAEVTLTATLK